MCQSFLAQLRVTVPTISMAALQGYLLRNKNEPTGAVDHLHMLITDNENRHSSQQHQHQQQQSEPLPQTTETNLDELQAMLAVNQKNNAVKTRPVKPLSIEEVDKMVFNPQKGWDAGL